MSFGPLSQGGPLEAGDFEQWVRVACLRASDAIVNCPPFAHDYKTRSRGEKFNDPRLSVWSDSFLYIEIDLPRTPDNRTTYALRLARSSATRLFDNATLHGFFVTITNREVAEAEIRRGEVLTHPITRMPEEQARMLMLDEWQRRRGDPMPTTHRLSLPDIPWSLPWWTNGIQREDFENETAWRGALNSGSSAFQFRNVPRFKKAFPVFDKSISDLDLGTLDLGFLRTEDANAAAIQFVTNEIRKLARDMRLVNHIYDHISQPSFVEKLVGRNPDKYGISWVA